VPEERILATKGIIRYFGWKFRRIMPPIRNLRHQQHHSANALFIENVPLVDPCLSG
jgi:hypothetical protein